jgi:hypothetical protein
MLRVLAAFVLISPLGAQEAALFPLSLVLEAAEYASLWRPDWPVDFPPDAFKVGSGFLAGASVEGEGSFSYSAGPGGRAGAFPFMLNGRMVQAAIDYGPSMEILKIVISGETPEIPDDPSDESLADNAWEMEVMEYFDSRPMVLRVRRGDAWYFISLSRGGNRIMETWYDEEGNMLGAYDFSLGEVGNEARIRNLRYYSDNETLTEFHYDSRLLVSECSGPYGAYKALFYREDLPRYWERRPSGEGQESGSYTLQWDEAGFLRRITGGEIDCRYEYTLDVMGNWIERREIRMTRRLGLLAPSPGTTWKRVLEYGE